MHGPNGPNREQTTREKRKMREREKAREKERLVGGGFIDVERGKRSKGMEEMVRVTEKWRGNLG